MERRNFLKIAGTGALTAIVSPGIITACSTQNQKKPFAGHIFEKLPYAYNALEPSIDAQTMELHYSKHHKGYFNKFISAAEKVALMQTPMHEIFANIAQYDESIRNNGGGYYNHTLFWNNLSPEGGEPSSELLSAINASFGDIDSFKEAFSKEAKTQFGSGWAWLVLNKNGKLAVGNTANQDNPLMPDTDISGVPLIAFDVWEHAYYLHYQNRRGDYIDAFWNIINWKEVNKRFKGAVDGEWLG
jgi:Fe-Mn family superoxide dismutase